MSIIQQDHDVPRSHAQKGFLFANDGGSGKRHVVVRSRDSRPILARHGTTISTLCLRCAPILVPIRADAKSTQGSKLEADISMGCRVLAVYRDVLDYMYIVSDRVGRLTIPVRPPVATPAALASARPVSCSSCSTPCQSRTRADSRRHVGV